MIFLPLEPQLPAKIGYVGQESQFIWYGIAFDAPVFFLKVQ